MTKSDSRLATLLVAWYGVYQAAHIVFNSLYFAGVITSFPPGPPGGWTQQALNFLFILVLVIPAAIALWQLWPMVKIEMAARASE